MIDFWSSKRVLITGACGTVGSELIAQLNSLNVSLIIGIDNNESDLFFLNEKYRYNKGVNFFLCDIKNKSQLQKFFRDIDVVIHCAARKHVIINEISPEEAIYTNIVGTQNIIDSALENSVERVLFTSSDKAVNPTNVMGTSKLMGERLMTAANSSKRGEFPIFSSTRFGNVLGSNGSVIPIFRNQIMEGGPITLTDPEMSRFVMTVDEACKLVLESVSLARGGEVFVTKMPIMRIEDLAYAMIDVLSKEKIDVNVIGAKAGEKLYEELINDEEVRRTIEIDNYFAVIPAFRGLYSNANYDYTDNQKPITRIYRSDLETSMTRKEILDYLLSKKLVSVD